MELDGVHAGGTRRRRTTVIAYTGEEEVARIHVKVPSSPHSIDAQNLRDPGLGLIGQLEKLAREHHSGLTNERPRPVQRRRSGGWTLTTISRAVWRRLRSSAGFPHGKW